MFNTETDQRLHLWFEFRNSLEISDQPLDDVITFWDPAPRIPYNNRIDPYYDGNWPTPWEIIDYNKYDDFTLSLMMGWSLLLTKRFETSQLSIHTLVDESANRMYNVLNIDNTWALNFQDHEVVPFNSVPSLYRVENIMPLKRPR